jgi:hypothetical protein
MTPAAAEGLRAVPAELFAGGRRYFLRMQTSRVSMKK